MSRFDGDPKLILGPNGSRLQFTGGQCLMDQGIENATQIALLTKKGWWGNTLFNDQNKKIGSDYIDESKKPITANSLSRIEKAAISALNDPLFGEVKSEVTNSESYRIDNIITVSPPGRDAQKLLIDKNGANWINQKINPAYRQVL